MKELKAAFVEAVDDYLAYCEAEGISPDKKYSGVLNIRIPPMIHSRIAMLAQEAGSPHKNAALYPISSGIFNSLLRNRTAKACSFIGKVNRSKK